MAEKIFHIPQSILNIDSGGALRLVSEWREAAAAICKNQAGRSHRPFGNARLWRFRTSGKKKSYCS